MNKRIYYQDKFIEFSAATSQTQHNQAIKNYEAPETEGRVLTILDDFLDEENNFNIVLPESSFVFFFETIKNELHYIEAAGGFIEKTGLFLCIHRLGRWDLPKGKLEKDETVEAAAVRECEEECGIQELSIKYPLTSTFHIYPYKKSMAIKQSYWFYMESSYSKPLTPQVEENIDQVKWFSQKEVEAIVLADTYFTISDVICEALSIAHRS
jgi:8-oxo-dGTP pyrophosphatase MutT (NUDIX family)